MPRMGDLAATDVYSAFDVPTEQSTGVGWANRLGEILTARPVYDETTQYTTASPLVNISEGDIGRATEAAMGVSGGGMTVQGPKGIRAYHSSPHDFDKFGLSQIGTGEGAQVYGHGLYFAENPAVSGQGGQYWNQFLNHPSLTPGQQHAGSRLRAEGFDREKAIAATQRDVKDWIEATQPADYAAQLRGSSTSHYDREHAKKMLALRQEELDALVGNKAGPRTYEVNINADPAHFLDWDKALKEQAPYVRDVLRQKNGPFLDAGDMGSNWNAPGSQYYRFRSSPGMRNPAQLSEQLSKEYGIPGIKYLDQGSRGAGTGSSNYVVFDDKLIDILKKYGLAGLPAGAAGMGALAAQDRYE